jgi:hypothetical protein
MPSAWFEVKFRIIAQTWLDTGSAALSASAGEPLSPTMGSAAADLADSTASAVSTPPSGWGYWAGPVFWPFFFGDALTFALWPYAFYDPFFAYGPDLLLTSIFGRGPRSGPITPTILISMGKAHITMGKTVCSTSTATPLMPTATPLLRGAQSSSPLSALCGPLRGACQS